jgi:hypothetical protein
VLQVFVSNAFDTKVVHTQVEPDGSWDVFPESRHARLFEVPIASKTEFEELVSKDARLWEVVHTLSKFHEDITIKGRFA